MLVHQATSALRAAVFALGAARRLMARVSMPGGNAGVSDGVDRLGATVRRSRHCLRRVCLRIDDAGAVEGGVQGDAAARLIATGITHHIVLIQ